MRNLSKSKIISYRQCPKRLWLEIHKPELRDDSASQAVFAIGNQVGDMAQEVYNTDGTGVLIDINEIGWPEAFARSGKLLSEGKSIVFEAAMRTKGALALADVMIPVRGDTGENELSWEMIEVKSAASVKDYYRDDIAVQSYIATACGVPLSSVSLAHIDTSFVYQGDGDYSGLFHRADLTEEAMSRHDEVEQWLTGAHEVAARDKEPDICTGAHCSSPFSCPFIAHCQSQEPQPEFPVSCLPNFTKKAMLLANEGITELKDVPKSMLSNKQAMIRENTLAGTTYFDADGASAELARETVDGAPHYFLDFETSNSAIPVWKGNRPFQNVPFQFSLHTLQPDGTLDQETFLDLSGDDPRRGFAEALVKSCGDTGPVFVYNASFEKTVIRREAIAFPDLADDLSAIVERIVDLLPIAKNYYYHPSQNGSWSIKYVLPAICPDLHYSELDGVQDGQMAISAYQEAIMPNTTPERKAEIYSQLDKYCALDTLAMVRLWEFFSGR